LISLPTILWADDELPKKNAWLSDFVKPGLRSAYSKWSYSDPQDFNRAEVKETSFEFATQEFHFDFVLTHSSNWDVLTKDGTIDPPPMRKNFSSSKVSNWSNFKGKGSYKETYSRLIPNWMHFRDLDTLLILLSSYNTEPAINKLLWSDEEKYLKKLKNAERSTEAYIWRQFMYDHKGNIIGISTDYLVKQGSERKFDDRMKYEMFVENKEGARIVLKPYVSESAAAIFDGVEVHQDNNKLILFSEVLNRKLHRFAPEIFRNPKKVMNSFLLSLQKASGKPLERLGGSSSDE
jgi:hypothetical protein